MKPFELERATDRAAAIVAAAAAATAQQGASVRFLAGGTTLVDLMKLGVEQPDRVVDINRLGLDGIREEPDGVLRIGASVKNSDLAHDPLVRQEISSSLRGNPVGSVDPAPQCRHDGGQSATANPMRLLP